MVALLRMPFESLELVSEFLPAPDVLSLISTHSILCKQLGTTAQFWQRLESIQYQISFSDCDGTTKQDAATDKVAPHDAKQSYLVAAHLAHLGHHGGGAVHWYRPAVRPNALSEREGHVACRLWDYIVVTGGFTEDGGVYVKPIHQPDGWQRLVPQGGTVPEWAYGCSLTPIGEDGRAVLFGGFGGGGYSGETAQVAILHLTKDKETGALSVHWETKICRHVDATMDVGGSVWASTAARAYHAATLLFGRWLVVVGGMQSRGSILTPLVLDVYEWTWHSENIATAIDEAPSRRHGCSMVPDLKRNRLVLFGGGSGSDLLRSGRDNTEVWELSWNGGVLDKDRLLDSFPLVWRQLHADQPHTHPTTPQEQQPPPPVDPNNADEPNRLHPAEKLCLGRCHAGHLVGKDTVLFAFGSGRPTTNTVLGYNLDRDEFFGITVRGPVPRARFTFASVYMEDLGMLFVHGGFSTQEGSQAISDTAVLDLAPGLGRPFRLWSAVRVARSYPLVTNEQASAMGQRQEEGDTMRELIRHLIHTAEGTRRLAAGAMLADQQMRGIDGRSAIFLNLIATGRLRLTDDGEMLPVLPDRESDEDDDDDFDSDYETMNDNVSY